jgi:hypothetical protein
MDAFAETSALTGEGVAALFQACFALYLREAVAIASSSGKRRCVLQQVVSHVSSNFTAPGVGPVWFVVCCVAQLSRHQ